MVLANIYLSTCAPRASHQILINTSGKTVIAATVRPSLRAVVANSGIGSLYMSVEQKSY